jgi:hypothetical protein
VHISDVGTLTMSVYRGKPDISVALVEVR